jgi:hypothetical protein
MSRQALVGQRAVLEGRGLKNVTGVDVAGCFEEGTVAEAAIFSCGLTAADKGTGALEVTDVGDATGESLKQSADGHDGE